MRAAVRAVRNTTDARPGLALILGSGLGELASRIKGSRIPYAGIPGLPTSTVRSHAGELVVGTLAGRSVVVLSGRIHMYEGHTAAQVAAPVRLMHALGAERLIVTNAAGALNAELTAGSLAVIEDHLSLANLAGGDPLRGTEERFVSMNRAYAPELIAVAETAAETLDMDLPRAVYAHVVGPSFETPAEVRMLRSFADLVGMSTVPEVVVARSLGLEVLGLSAVSNVCVGEVGSDHLTTADEAWETLERAAPKMTGLIVEIIKSMPEPKTSR